MTKTITVRELFSEEINKLLTDRNFTLLKPVNCNQCGQKDNFERRIFEITGVAKSKQADDETQKLLKYHFKHRYSIDFIFFKTY